jgi:MFS family permease
LGSDEGVRTNKSPIKYMTTPGHDPYSALRFRDFRYFTAARFCITIAIQIQAVLVGWQVYAITKNPLSLGLIGLSEALPSIAVALYAGHIADIVPRKKIILSTVSVLLFCSLLLLLYSLGDLNNWFPSSALPIYGIIFLSGIARGFLSPANFSFMPQLIPREKYSNAISWNSTIWQAAAVTGPAAGGLMYAFFEREIPEAGFVYTYFLDASLIFCGLVLYLLIQSRPIPGKIDEEQSVKEKLLAGLKFVFANQLILSAISLDLFAVLFGGAVALLPVFADEILNSGAEGLGLLRSSPAIGAVLVAIYLTYFPIKKFIGRKLLLAVAGFGVCMIAFALSEWFWISFALLALSGGLDSVSVIVRSSLIHNLTPEHMKGRVSAVNSIFIGSSNEIGAFESGFAAKLMGVIPSVIFGGCMTLGVVGITALKADKLRKLQSLN